MLITLKTYQHRQDHRVSFSHAVVVWIFTSRESSLLLIILKFVLTGIIHGNIWAKCLRWRLWSRYSSARCFRRFSMICCSRIRRPHTDRVRDRWNLLWALAGFWSIHSFDIGLYEAVSRYLMDGLSDWSDRALFNVLVCWMHFRWRSSFSLLLNFCKIGSKPPSTYHFYYDSNIRHTTLIRIVSYTFEIFHATSMQSFGW